MKTEVSDHKNPTPGNGLVLCAATVVEAGFENRVKAAHATGYSAISLFPEHYLNARRRQKLAVSDMRHMLHDHGIGVACIDPLLDWFGPSESRAEQLLYEAAEALEAPTINIAPAFGPELSREDVIEALVRVCTRAAKHGLNVDVEFLPWSIIPNLPTLLDIVTASGCSNAFGTLDLLHFYRSGGTVTELESLGAEKLHRISNIQICDITAHSRILNWRQRISASRALLATGLDGVRVMGLKTMLDVAAQAHHCRDDASTLMTEATCHRLLPGQGDIPILAILQTFDRLGCQPLLGLEVTSLALQKLPTETAAQQAMTAYRQLGS